MPASEADLKHVAELISKVRISMLTTETESGELRSRPMAVEEAPFEGVLRFLTLGDSGKVEEIQQDRNVNVSVSDVKEGIFVSVSGKGKLNRDKSKIAELWKDEYKVWVPNGKENPHLAILEVTATTVEFWDTPNDQDEHSQEKEEEARDHSEHGTIEVNA